MLGSAVCADRFTGGLSDGHRQQLAGPSQLLAPVAVGQEAVVTDAHEALGQHVLQKAPQELHSIKHHLALLAALGVVLVGKTNLAVVRGQQSLIRDRHAMGVARQVFQRVHAAVHNSGVTQSPPKQIAKLKTGRTPLWLTMTPDGKTVYVANTADGTISVFDAESKKERKRIQLPKGKAPKRMLVLRVPTSD